MKALDGIKIVNAGSNLPGPLVSFHLQKLGATVTKINPPQGDPLLAGSPEFYRFLCGAQNGVTLDLKSESGRAALDQHLREADLLLTSSRPDSLKRLGLDWPKLHGEFPSLCHVNITGFPPPHEARAGHDLTYQAHAGLLRPPHMPVTCVADLAGAHQAALEALGLLFGREKTGTAGHLNISLSAALELYAKPLELGLTTPVGLLGGSAPEYNVYRAREGWVAVACLEPHFKKRIMSELGLAGLKQEDLKKVIATRTAAAWESWAIEKDLPLAALRDLE